jgi:hypothetical protein
MSLSFRIGVGIVITLFLHNGCTRLLLLKVLIRNLRHLAFTLDLKEATRSLRTSSCSYSCLTKFGSNNLILASNLFLELGSKLTYLNTVCYVTNILLVEVLQLSFIHYLRLTFMFKVLSPAHIILNKETLSSWLQLMILENLPNLLVFQLN